MKIEDKFITEQQAKRIDELGFKAISQYVYFDGKLRENEIYYHAMDEVYQAYDVAELGEILPVTIFFNKRTIYINYTKDDTHFIYWYSCLEDGEIFAGTGETEAQARGNLLIQLLENKIIEV